MVYRGSVQVTQGDLKLVSDTLTITLQNDKQDGKPDPKPVPAAGGAAPGDNGRVQEIVALGNVRIDQGQRWAVGGRAVLRSGAAHARSSREDPVLHDGPNEVAGDRVVVFLDEDRSVVEGGQKRVKAVLYPNEKPGAAKPAPKPRRRGAESAHCRRLAMNGTGAALLRADRLTKSFCGSVCGERRSASRCRPVRWSDCWAPTAPARRPAST